MRKKLMVFGSVMLGISIIGAQALTVYDKYFKAISIDGKYIENVVSVGKEDMDKDLNIFFGDSMYNYANYYDSNNKITFNGNYDSLFNTEKKASQLNVWRNDRKSEQMIIVGNKNKNLESVSAYITNFDNGVTAQVSASNLIKSEKSKGTVAIPNGMSYHPDKIYNNYANRFDDFIVQPFLVNFSSYSDKVVEGTYEYEITLNYKVDGVFKTKVEKISIQTYNIDANIDNGFSFNAMTSPATLATYNLNPANVEGANSSRTISQRATDNKPNNQEAASVKKYLTDKEMYFDWMTFNKDYYPTYLKDDYKDLLKENYKYMNEMNSEYAYAPTFGNSVMRIKVKNNNVYNTHEEYLEDISKSTKEMLENDNLEYTFDFDGMKKYIEFAKENGFKKIYLPSITRGTNGIKFFYDYDNNNGISSNFSGNENAPNLNFYIVSALKDLLIGSSNAGIITEAGQLYIDKIIPKLTSSLLEFINENKELLKLDDGNDMQFYISMDETSYSIDSDIVKAVKSVDTDSKLKFHAYVGWQYDIDIKTDKGVEERIVNMFDDITIQQREIIMKALDDKTIFERLKKAFAERKAMGKKTWMYSSWNNAPATYVASLPSESYWGMLAAYKFGLDGFTRFAYEGYRSNITADGDYDNSHKNEPGDAYLMYPTYYLKNSAPSMRIFNIEEAYHLVKKMEVLTEIGESKLSFTNKEKELILNQIGRPTKFTQDSNFIFTVSPSLKDIDITKTSTYVNVMIENVKQYLELKGF
ncbi:hypothetical protein SCHIN_v1c03600 [Spiroplasma chinense]|uniref:Glycoside hydrolase 123 catalytic domain-containing protein n=1 Tax=Spiroplasma chinense TaxID=216932 RepID=A0A5B9Y5L3_9MOLU|nr:glycoside hydrolase domain-containing protein [Spiroplasma chinense]QEH61557.1 hypothetical protein SCHIN_v1c03600 [Spiroplasma chinense]